MKFDPKDVFSAVGHFSKKPTLAITIFALIVPVTLLFGAAKFSSASNEALFFFAVLGISSLLYSVWIVRYFNRREESSDEE